MNEWIRHADNKVGLTLAASGAVGVMLYNLVRALPECVSWWVYITPGVCAALLVLTVYFCTFALNPRTKAGDSVDDKATLSEPNLIFFGAIDSSWTREKYIHEIAGLTADRPKIIREVAAQIHVNAYIASKKFASTKRAVWALSLAVAALACTAFLVLTQN